MKFLWFLWNLNLTGHFSFTTNRSQFGSDHSRHLTSAAKKKSNIPKCESADLQGVSDGAAALVIASDDALKEHKLTPLARIVAYHVSGCDPSIMGIGKWHGRRRDVIWSALVWKKPE